MLITSNREDSGLLLLDQTDYDAIVFGQGVTWSQTSGGSYAIQLAGYQQRFVMNGTLVSAGNGFVLSDASESLQVSATGQIVCSGGAIAIDYQAVSAVISNAGLIQSSTGTALYVLQNTNVTTFTNTGTVQGGVQAGTGATLSITNSGLMIGAMSLAGNADTVTNDGRITGNLALGAGADTLQNTDTIVGNITTGSGSDTLVNAGTIQGAVTFNSTAADSTTLTNDGLISGNIFTDAGRDTVVNTGRITGTLSIGAGAGTITNSGEIAGSVFAIGLANADKVTVLNTGRISGDITTGSAADTIDTHLGTIGGGLFGGKGDDTYVIAGMEIVREVAAASGGFDTVLSYGDYTLGIGLEALSLFGAARLGVGNTLDNYLTANALGSTLLAGKGNDVLTGQDGDDVLRGGAGADTIYEADGQNQIYGGAGDDKVYLAGGDNAVAGGSGDDLLVSGDGADSLSGDPGNDTVSYANSTSRVVISLDAGTAAGGYAEGDSLYGIENLVGSALADTLTGSVGANRLDGGAGVDTLAGGEGDDVLTGGAAADVVDGGAGFDIADYSTATAAIVLNGGTIAGDIVGDSFASIEGFQLSGLNDTFVAVYDLSLFIGGGAGNDTIVAKGAADRLNGDTGNDTLTGGGAGDVFQFDRYYGANFQVIGWGKDSVTDFQDGVDLIDLSHAVDIHAFADLTITGTRTGTLIAFGGDSILLSNVASSNITAADFIFG